FQPDGKLIAVFPGFDGGAPQFGPGLRLERFTTSGALDSSFGSGGVANGPNPPCCFEEPLYLVVTSSSTTVLGDRRSTFGGGFAGFFLRRFTSAGAADSTLDEVLPGIGFPRGLAVDSSGRLITAEEVGVPADRRISDVMVERRLASGDTDSAF